MGAGQPEVNMRERAVKVQINRLGTAPINLHDCEVEIDACGRVDIYLETPWDPYGPDGAKTCHLTAHLNSCLIAWKAEE